MTISFYIFSCHYTVSVRTPLMCVGCRLLAVEWNYIPRIIKLQIHLKNYLMFRKAVDI